MSQLVWLPCDDAMAFARAAVTRSATSDDPTVQLQRLDNGAKVSLAAAEFERLSLASGAGEPVDDLATLAQSNDATFLETLRQRYANDDIYTAIGPVIISINPCAPSPVSAAPRAAQPLLASHRAGRAGLASIAIDFDSFDSSHSAACPPWQTSPWAGAHPRRLQHSASRAMLRRRTSHALHQLPLMEWLAREVARTRSRSSSRASQVQARPRRANSACSRSPS
jgi:hypothetical protein